MAGVPLDAWILVIDDEPGIREGCRRVLERSGARVETAATGAEGLQRLEDGEFDIAIIDLVMPQLGGMEILDRIAATEMSVVPLVITGHASIETAIEAVKRGAFDYLPKPFVPLELTARVERALQWHRLRQESFRRLLELDTEKSRLRTIVNSLADGIIVANVDGQVVLTNPAACAVLGIEEFSGEPRPLAEVIRDPRLLRLVLNASAGPEGSEAPAARTGYAGELRTGDSIYQARVVPIETAEGTALGTATVLRDVTDLMRLERAKSQFMSKVAHELKAPLAAVQGLLQILVGDPAAGVQPPELTAERVRDVVGRCSKRVEGMTRLVMDLLYLSRAEALPPRQVESLSLAGVVADVVEANRPLAERTGIALETEVSADCPELSAGRDDFTRMVSNLVNNAIRYNRPGGRVSVQVRPEDGFVRLEVSDTGLGIPAEALPRLGEEFFRVGTPDRKGIPGTGLGISLVKRTLETYGGRLEIHSRLGEGSTFALLLPVGAQPPE